jgi:8-oxo-dGTP pyrophosphatase MutT (NUDIX family)
MLLINRRIVITTLSTGLRTPHLLSRAGTHFPFSVMSSSSSSDDLPRVDFSLTETVGTTRWMRLETLSYHVPPDPENSSGETLRKWDRAVRTTKKSEDSVDAVVILAILKYDKSDPTRDEIVCVKQFRPPVDGYTIELPAGLIDPNEDPATAAEREFKEETGYIGKVLSVSPPSFLSPGLTNESACMVRMEIDMTLEHNTKNHESKATHDGLEGCERDRGLEKLLLPRVGFLNALHELQKKDDVKVFAALYSLAVGMSLNEGAQV